MTTPSWQGAALLRPGVLAFTGSIGPTASHAHHAVQIMLAATPVTVVDRIGTQHHGRQVIIPADAAHRIEQGADVGTVLFLEPESEAGRSANTQAVRDGWSNGPTLVEAANEPRLADVVDGVIATLITTGYSTPPENAAGQHPAVTAALAVLPELAAAGTVRSADVASHAAVSSSRLTHLFTEQVGIPLRRYVLWLRLHLVMARVYAGDDLTAAAHAAGFSDSAHLTRTCRAMFGLPPSAISHHVTWGSDAE